ncbi:hypothetical protein C0J29_04780 [Mycobacterium paragordonae]|nr:hypothetical protein C0J29_04780 [Mycobacterium paragordonae]
MFCTAGMLPPWKPAVGRSGGGGGTGACCSVGNSGMNLPGCAFWWPSTGSVDAVGRTVTATATASDANPRTANPITALLISNRLRLCGFPPPASGSSSSNPSSNSSYSSYSSP